MSLSKVLGEPRSNRSLEVIAERYRLPPEKVQEAATLMRTALLQVLDQELASKDGALAMMRRLAHPAFAQIDQYPDMVVNQEIRLVGDALHRQLSRHDANSWETLDGIARACGLSHQVLRAMAPALTLIVLTAIRRATAPAFQRLLQHHRPNDTSSDPFQFASERADLLEGRNIPPETALRWLDRVLARADEEHMPLMAER